MSQMYHGNRKGHLPGCLPISGSHWSSHMMKKCQNSASLLLTIRNLGISHFFYSKEMDFSPWICPCVCHTSVSSYFVLCIVPDTMAVTLEKITRFFCSHGIWEKQKETISTYPPECCECGTVTVTGVQGQKVAVSDSSVKDDHRREVGLLGCEERSDISRPLFQIFRCSIEYIDALMLFESGWSAAGDLIRWILKPLWVLCFLFLVLRHVNLLYCSHTFQVPLIPAVVRCSIIFFTHSH